MEPGDPLPKPCYVICYILRYPLLRPFDPNIVAQGKAFAISHIGVGPSYDDERNGFALIV
jgi:hypothetical protein